MGVPHRNPVIMPSPKISGDLARLIGEAEDDLRDSRALDVIDLEKQKGDIGQRDNRFGYVSARGRNLAPFPPASIKCLDHDFMPPRTKYHTTGHVQKG